MGDCMCIIINGVYEVIDVEFERKINITLDFLFSN